MNEVSFVYQETQSLANDRPVVRVLGRGLAYHSWAPQFVGHGCVVLPDGAMQRNYIFGPKDFPQRLKEDRAEAELLAPRYAVPQKKVRFSNLVPRFMGEISDHTQAIRRSAEVSMALSDQALEKVRAYIDETKERPLTYRAVDSNCLVFMTNVAAVAGLDLSLSAQGRRVEMPDGILVAFASLARGMKQTGATSFAGTINGTPASIRFHDSTLPERVQRKLNIPCPPSSPPIG